MARNDTSDRSDLGHRRSSQSSVVFQQMLPEQEDVEWHSDGVSLSTDSDGLQDPRVSQLAADQLVLKHARLLNTDSNVNTFNRENVRTCRTNEAAVKHANAHQWTHNV